MVTIYMDDIFGKAGRLLTKPEKANISSVSIQWEEPDKTFIQYYERKEEESKIYEYHYRLDTTTGEKGFVREISYDIVPSLFHP